jgi:hypothetical protein
MPDSKFKEKFLCWRVVLIVEVDLILYSVHSLQFTMANFTFYHQTEVAKKIFDSLDSFDQIARGRKRVDQAIDKKMEVAF